MSRIGILGAGTWGIALSRLLSGIGHEVTVWSALPKEIEQLSKTRVHPNLPGMKIPENVCFTKEIREVCSGKEILLFAVPSVYVRSTAALAAPFIPDGQLIADAAKGIETDTCMTMTEVIRDALSKDGTHAHIRLAALTGPTHAEEVALDLPTAITAASEDPEAAAAVQAAFSAPYFRVYTNSDVRGAEICGALKNIVALASGISDGLGYGDNAKAAIITRGLAEIKRLGRKLGCADATFSGLAGMGDLIVTATSRHSRNNRAGHYIGQGFSAEEAVKKVGMVVEGMNALPAALKLAEEYQADMPIVRAVDAVVNHGLSPKDAVNSLMNREWKSEV